MVKVLFERSALWTQGLLASEDVEDEDNDCQEVRDNDVDSAELLFALDPFRLSWGFGTDGSGDLDLIERLCSAWAFAKADPEGSLRSRDLKRPLMPFFPSFFADPGFWSFGFLD